MTTPADRTPVGPAREDRAHEVRNVARRTLLTATAMAVPAVTILAAAPALAASETATATLEPRAAKVADGDTQLFTLTVLSGNGKALADESVSLFVSSNATLPGFTVSVDGGGSTGIGGFVQATTNAAGQVLLRAQCGRLTSEQGATVTLNAGVSGIGATDASAEFAHGTITLTADNASPAVNSTVTVSGSVAKPFGLGAYPSVKQVKLSVPAGTGATLPSSVPVQNGSFSAAVAGPSEPRVVSVTATDDYLVTTLDISFIAAGITTPPADFAGQFVTYISFWTHPTMYPDAPSNQNVEIQIPNWTPPAPWDADPWYTQHVWRDGLKGWEPGAADTGTVLQPGSWVNAKSVHFGTSLIPSKMPLGKRSPTLPDGFPKTVAVRRRPGSSAPGGIFAGDNLVVERTYHSVVAIWNGATQTNDLKLTPWNYATGGVTGPVRYRFNLTSSLAGA